MTQIKVRGVLSVQYEDGTVDDVHVDAIRLVEGVCVCLWLQRIETKVIVGLACWWIDSCISGLGSGFVIAVDWSDEEQCVDIESMKSQTSRLGCAMNTIYSYVWL